MGWHVRQQNPDRQVAMIQQIQTGNVAGENFSARHSIAAVHVEISIEQKFEMSSHAQEIIYHVAQSSKLSPSEKAWAVRMAAFIDEFAAGSEQLFAKLGGVIQLMEMTSSGENYSRQSPNEWAEYYQTVRAEMHGEGGLDGDVKIIFDAQLEEFVFESRGISLAEQDEQIKPQAQLPELPQPKPLNPRGGTKLPLNEIA